MTYTPTDWVDNVSLVDAAKMDKIEQGIVDAHADIAALQAEIPNVINGRWLKGTGGAAVWTTLTATDVASTATGDVAATTVQAAIAELASEKQAVSAKGAASGYASLDATTKVPVAQLPPAAVPGYATTLPGSPVDGQETIFVDSLTNPIYQWRFRYNAGSSSAYKWEFVGGSAWTMGHGAAHTASGAWTFFGTGTIPRAGEYVLESEVTDLLWSAVGTCYQGPGISTAANAIAYSLAGTIVNTGSYGGHIKFFARPGGCGHHRHLGIGYSRDRHWGTSFGYHPGQSVLMIITKSEA